MAVCDDDDAWWPFRVVVVVVVVLNEKKKLAKKKKPSKRKKKLTKSSKRVWSQSRKLSRVVVIDVVDVAVHGGGVGTRKYISNCEIWEIAPNSG